MKKQNQIALSLIAAVVLAGCASAPSSADLPDPNLLVSNTNLAELGV